MKNLISFVALLLLFTTSNFAQTGNYSLHFDGTDDHVNFATMSGVTGGNYTIEGWFKTSETNTLQEIVQGSHATNGAYIHIEIQLNGTLRFTQRPQANPNVDVTIYSISTVNNNVYHHFAATKSSDGKLRLYIDGFLETISCATISNITSTPSCQFGENFFDGASNYRRFNGRMDEIRFWNYARNAKQIYTNYKKEMTGTEAGLVGYYKFDDNTSTCDVQDCSTLGNHGTRIGVNGANNLPKYSTNKPVLVDAPCGTAVLCPVLSGESVDRVPVNPSYATTHIDQEHVDKITLFPNPSKDLITIRGATNLPTSAKIFDTKGMLVAEYSIIQAEVQIDVKELPDGLYLIQIGEEDEVKQIEFVKE